MDHLLNYMAWALHLPHPSPGGIILNLIHRKDKENYTKTPFFTYYQKLKITINDIIRLWRNRQTDMQMGAALGTILVNIT